MIQVGELHLVESFVTKENLAGAEIRMDDALLMDKLEKVDDLKANIDRLDLGEKGRHALLLAAWDSVSGADCRSGRLLLDLHTRLLLSYILFQAVTRVLLYLAIDDALGELTERNYAR